MLFLPFLVQAMDEDDLDPPYNIFTRSINLQDMCLIAVIRDIDFFVYNKTIPQKHIDFLFRVYSDEVLLRHKALKIFIDEDTMLWFLNPHLRKVTLLPKFHSERILQQLKMIGFGITSLNLENSKFTENGLNSIVSCMPHVVHLNLSCTSCSDETLTCIQKFCPELETLNVARCSKVTNCGMENLCQGRLLLKKLNVLHSLVTNFGIITILDRMPSLEYVEYHELLTLIYHFSIANEKQYNLTELIYNGPNIWDDNAWGDRLHLNVIQAFVKVCPKLKKLHFLYPVSEEVLNACAQFKNLEELKIKLSHGNVLRKNYDILAPIHPISNNLKTLILSCVTISLVKLTECFKNLENLYLKKVSFTPFDKEDIKVTKTNLLSLVVKDIRKEPVTFQAITLLISLSKNVTSLYLKNIKGLPNTKIFEAILKSMKNLTLVNFDSTYMDMQSAHSFFQVPSIRTVIMDKSVHTLEVFKEPSSCTLSWRYMSDFEYCPQCNLEDDGEEEINNDDTYYYDNKVITDETDVLSERCCTYDSYDMESYFSDTGTGSSYDTPSFLVEIPSDYSYGDDLSDESYSES